VEAASYWLSPPEAAPPTWRRGTSDEELIRIAEALGARNLVATHFGTPEPVELAAERFGGLCDRAADAGLQVTLEFLRSPGSRTSPLLGTWSGWPAGPIAAYSSIRGITAA